MARTVEDGLRKLAEEHGAPYKQIMEEWFGGKVEPSVPDRYRRLLFEVALRLPDGWDYYATWTVEAEWEENPLGIYAHVVLEAEGESENQYIIKIHPSVMDRLSDAACRGIFAHELGHIATKLLHELTTGRGKVYVKTEEGEYVPMPAEQIREDSADTIALRWGFDRELETLREEDRADTSE